MLIRERTPVSAALIERLPSLKMVSQLARTTHHIDVAACTARGIAIATGNSKSPVSPAEHTFALILAAARSIPLDTQHTERLLGQFVTVVRATVKGNIVISLVQGLLGGIAFAVLGLPAALLWGTLMALLSLLPAVGAALVWGPVAAYMLLTGQVASAIGLTVWGVGVIGLVDNLLRPILVGKDTELPDYLILIATLGGIAVFGINGFVIGPVIAAMFLVAWQLMTARGPTQR